MSEHNGQLPDFDSFSLLQFKFKYRGKPYVLAEASKGDVVKYREAVFKATRPGSDGRPTTFTGIAETEPLLVSLCVYKASDTGELPLNNDGTPDIRQRVHVDVVKSWPNRVVSPLFDKCREISEIDKGATVEDIDKQIALLQKQRAELVKGTAEDPAKNALTDTPES